MPPFYLQILLGIFETVISALPLSEFMDSGRGPRPEYLSLEISGAALSVVLNQGTINFWFGRSADKSVVARILRLVSRIDPTAEHERDVLCSFDKISEFENEGYILSSYAKKMDKYRAVFVVPFSNSRALDKFIESIYNDLDYGEVKITLSWGGGRARIHLLHQELEKLNCFSSMNITYKEDQRRDQRV